MAIPQSETADGFEKQLGVNHLGHFALIRSCVSIFGIAPKYRWDRIRDSQSVPAGRYRVTHDPIRGKRSDP
jgi:NAD(P)-dependent dehydrogenase (short-subunit alcohol dehydrogenase family)